MLEFNRISFTNIYKDVGSILIRIHKKGKYPIGSLLINAHYDSQLGSPAASDDAVSCAIMLETLRCIVDEVIKGKLSFDSELLMIFNGAEETILQASHGLSINHPWLKNVKGFINLEACGSGGREIVFQAGPNNSWLIEQYVNSAPYPFATSLAQDIFESGIIPSDTDYRIFRDYANLSGLDIAYISNGYIYHTSYDQPKYIPKSSILRGGRNILNLTKSILTSNQILSSHERNDEPIYFLDLFGFTAFYARKRIINLINIAIIIVVVLYLVLRVRFVIIVKGTLFIFIAYFFGIIGPLAISLLLSYTPYGSMSWFSYPWIVLILYSCPTFLCASIFHVLTCSEGLRNIINHENMLFQGTLVFWILFDIVLLVTAKSASFIAMLWIVGPFIMNSLIGNALSKQFNNELRGLKVYCLTAIGILPALSLTTYISIVFLTVIIPVTGRMGNRFPSEVIVSILTSFLTIITTSYFIPLMIYIRHHVYKYFLNIATILVTIFVILAITNVTFPYSANPIAPKPMRLWALHVNTDVSGRNNNLPDSFIWIMPLDWNSIKPIIDASNNKLTDVKKVNCNREKFIMECGLPYLYPFMKAIPDTWLIPSKKAQISNPKLELTNTIVTRTSSRFEFTVDIKRGYLAFNTPSEIRNWSFTDKVPTKTPSGLTGEFYFCHVACGNLTNCEINFWLELSVSENKEENVLEVGVASHDVLNSNTEDLRKFKDVLPDWVDALTWEVSYSSHKFTF